MRRLLSLIPLLSLFAVPIAEAAPNHQHDNQNQGGRRGRGRGNVAQQPVAVSEPTSLALLSAGAVALLIRRRAGRQS